MAFRGWEQTTFGNITKQLKDLRKELGNLQSRGDSSDYVDDQKSVERDIDDLLAKDEQMWKQRARCLWLEHGDRNTSFFHKVADGRKKRNHIDDINNSAGENVTKEEKIEEVFRGYFEELFTSQLVQDKDVLQTISTSVTTQMKEQLSQAYSEEEIKAALAQMHPLKSPGPDEALSSMIRQAKTQHLLHGAQLCRTAPAITHLFFADDCIIFGRAKAHEVEVVKAILEQYEAVSGQKVNLDKSDISFSKGVAHDRRGVLSKRLGVQSVVSHGKYLGIPCRVGKSKRKLFQILEDRVRKKMKDWKRQFLLGAGKVVLIKSIIQAIPSYIMSCFLLPEQNCQRMNAMAARFFWGQKHDEKRVHWINWKVLCKSRENGDLTFRDLGCFNKALLTKQAW